MHSILIIGQSNMCGRGFKEEVEPIINDKLFVLRNGLWRGMYVPVNPDRKGSGISLVESFADLYSKEHDVEVGIIPCADGGTSLEQWQVGGLLFDHACYMAELAARTSTIVAVLWHQGEADCKPEKYPVYKENLAIIFEALRERLNLHDVPFLVGGLGDFLEKYFSCDIHVNVNNALKEYADENEMCGFVSAEGLTSNRDNLHFCSASLRVFGERYYEEFKKLENKKKVFTEKTPYQQTITDMERL